MQGIHRPSKHLLALAESVCIIMKVSPKVIRLRENNFVPKPCWWSSFTSPELFGGTKILQKLHGVDPSGIKKATIERLEEVFEEQGLSEGSVAHASNAAKGLFKWVNAIRTYYFAYQDAAPARNKLIASDLQVANLKRKKDALRAQIMEQ